MKLRSLLLLTLILGVLSFIVLRNKTPASPSALKAGSVAWPISDLNAVAQIGVSSGTQHVDLVRSEGGWRVASLWNHPADFDRIRELLRKLEALKVGDVLRGGLEELGSFGLDLHGTNATVAVPAVLEMSDEAGSPLGRITVGQPRTASGQPNAFTFPDSHYIRVDDGPVLLVDAYLDDLPRRAEDWMKRSIIDVRSEEVVSIEVSKAGETYGVVREGDAFRGTGTLEGQPVNVEGANLWMRSLQGLNAMTVADPASDRAALGLTSPDTVTVRLKSGTTLTASLGRRFEDRGRCAMWRATAETAQQEEATTWSAWDAATRDWIYILPDSAANQLTLIKEQLIAVSNTPPPAAAGP